MRMMMAHTDDREQNNQDSQTAIISPWIVKENSGKVKTRNEKKKTKKSAKNSVNKI